jgi:hypothetical protein
LCLEERGHDLRVEHGAAGADLLDGLEQPVGVAEPLLEQVGDTGRAALEQLEGVLGVVVLRQHHDAGPGVVASHPPSQLDPLRGERRGHADVEHHHVDRVHGQQLEQTVRALGGAEHLDPVHGVEHRARTLADEVVVLGDQQGGHPRAPVG